MFRRWAIVPGVLALGASCLASAQANPAYFSYSAGSRTIWDNAATADWAATSGGPYNQPWTGGSDAHFEGSGGP
jgi:hypothetical protein